MFIFDFLWLYIAEKLPNAALLLLIQYLMGRISRALKYSRPQLR